MDEPLRNQGLEMPARRPQPIMLALLSALALTLPAAAAADQALSLDITNRGPEALRCQWQLAHWMTAEPLRLAAGESGRLELWRDDRGQLFLRQEGEARPFHIETLLCGPDAGFGEARRAVALAPLRRGEAEALLLDCETGAALDCRTTLLP